MRQIKIIPLWVSHSSIMDFLRCPRAYYLRHVYKDPKTGRKINIINPAMALGLAVHDVLESISDIRAEKRMDAPLDVRFKNYWGHVSGEMGGFKDEVEEEVFKERGLRMMRRAMENPGLLMNKRVKLKSPDTLPPRFMLSAEENIILCGKIDWMEYLPEDDSVHIIDFKTGVREEQGDSLQLPIYALLAKNCQARKIRKISYWYLERDDAPVEQSLPDYEEAERKIVEVSLKIKKLRLDPPSHKATEGREGFVCPRGGCFSCRPFENILEGKARWIKTSGHMDVYVE